MVPLQTGITLNPVNETRGFQARNDSTRLIRRHQLLTVDLQREEALNGTDQFATRYLELHTSHPSITTWIHLDDASNWPAETLGTLHLDEYHIPELDDFSL